VFRTIKLDALTSAANNISVEVNKRCISLSADVVPTGRSRVRDDDIIRIDPEVVVNCGSLSTRRDNIKILYIIIIVKTRLRRRRRPRVSPKGSSPDKSLGSPLLPLPHRVRTRCERTTFHTIQRTRPTYIA